MTTPLPAGTRLLHIGPHKTGTTTLQAAFHQNRDALARQGVHYAGPNAQPMTAAMAAALGRGLPTTGGDASGRWEDLVDEVRASEAERVAISSEFFCEAEGERVAGIIEALGQDRVHVVVTLRPLVRIMASQWQQYMQNRFTFTYDEWLHAQLDAPDEASVTPSFWRRHRHDRLVERWADAVGTDRITVVVVDEQDKQMQLRAFEGLLGLEPETLVPRDVGANRSLTLTESELLRVFNQHFVDAERSPADYTRFVRFGAARHLQARRPDPAEARVLTPEWAVRRATEIGAEMVAGVRASGVRVIGDLDSLADPALAPPTGTNPAVETVPGEIAARFLGGLVRNMAAVPPRPAAASRNVGPLEQALREQHGAVRAVNDLEEVTAETRRLEQRLASVRRVGELSRREVAAELARRLAARVRRRAQA